MQDFLQHFPDTHIKVSPDFVETLIQSQHRESFTGVMRLQYQTDEVFLLTFLEGNRQKLYHLQENHTDTVAPQFWLEILKRPDASVAFVKLSEEALRLLRAIYEAPVLQVEKLTCSTQQLSEHVSQWAVGNSPSILQLQDGTTDRSYLIAGNSTPIVEGLSLADGAHFFIDDSAFAARLPLPEYQVTRFISDGAHDVWQEYALRYAFNPMIRMLLNRFSELTGRILTERLCQQLSQYAADGQLHVTITINGISNHRYYNSLQESVQVYLNIVDRFREEAGTAIGIRMIDGLAREIFLKLDVHKRELLKRYIFDEYVQKYGLGVVWR